MQLNHLVWFSISVFSGWNKGMGSNPEEELRPTESPFSIRWTVDMEPAPPGPVSERPPGVLPAGWLRGLAGGDGRLGSSEPRAPGGFLRLWLRHVPVGAALSDAVEAVVLRRRGVRLASESWVRWACGTWWAGAHYHGGPFGSYRVWSGEEQTGKYEKMSLPEEFPCFVQSRMLCRDLMSPTIGFSMMHLFHSTIDHLYWVADNGTTLTQVPNIQNLLLSCDGVSSTRARACPRRWPFHLA